MCSEYEPGRHARDEQEQAQEEIRRLFARYRAASGSESAEGVADVQAPEKVEEPALATR